MRVSLPILMWRLIVGICRKSQRLRGSAEGILLAPVADLVLMKLTSYRLRDRVHIQDMDSVGLITPEIEAGLPEPLRARLAEIPRDRVIQTFTGTSTGAFASSASSKE